MYGALTALETELQRQREAREWFQGQTFNWDKQQVKSPIEEFPEEATRQRHESDKSPVETRDVSTAGTDSRMVRNSIRERKRNSGTEEEQKRSDHERGDPGTVRMSAPRYVVPGTAVRRLGLTD
ncbi:unnamed protein product [Cylicostephanus goldi]|uniref:Uncharacterized protein n=1 Tax=Cylicostephanus goldi TaxID=71465 RepID=A0A3P6R5M3_CYLGO|nr:unnamed protein product [Cylicostephanus goldi]